ncbi:hypothetical protein KAU11_11010 [Candidatus Babeliales bacterium]|nr:hypothetical protein [Candidatus Babeliales bacterium]
MDKVPYEVDPEDINLIHISEDVSVRRYIVCAANKVDGIIICGARHHDIVMSAMYERLGVNDPKRYKSEQGFIDQFGNFVTRKEAAVIVTDNKQSLRDKIRTDWCLSENLY